MGHAAFQAELDFLTGRYAMRRRPAHGRLTSTPSRLPFGASLLEEVSLEGTRLRIPTPPRSYPPSSQRQRRGPPPSSLSESGSPRSAVSADLGDVRVVITPLLRHRLSVLDLRRLLALDLQHSPMGQLLNLQELERGGEESNGSIDQKSSSSQHQSDSVDSSRKSRTVRFEAPPACPLPLQYPGEERSQSSEVPRADWESEVLSLDAASVEVGHAQEDTHHQDGVGPLVPQPSVRVHEALEAVVVSDAITWCRPGEGPLPDPPEEEAAEAEGEAGKPKPPKARKDKAAVVPEKPQTTGRTRPAAKPAPPSGARGARPPPRQAKPTNTSNNNNNTTTNTSTTKPAVKMAKPAPKPRAESKEKKERAVVPKPPSRPRPVKEKKVKPPVEEEESDDDLYNKPIPLPISGPEDMIWTPEPEEEPPVTQRTPSPEPVVLVVPPKARSPVKKKEKLPPPPPRRRTPTPPPTPPPPPTADRRRVSFLQPEGEGEEEREALPDDGAGLVPDFSALLRVTPLPELPGGGEGTPPSQPGTRRSSLRSQLGTPRGSVGQVKSRWGERRRDWSLREQEERERLAEERRHRHAQMVDRLRTRRAGDGDWGGDGGDGGVEDDGFLAKYCILNPSTSEQYRYTFEQLDEGDKGYLTEEETVYGLRAINPSLSTSERTYLFRIMKLAGHRMKQGTDFRLFSILAALSQRVSQLDEWARTLMAQMDYTNLERKMFLCKTLWECNVDEERGGTISLDQLVVELRAGGVSAQHEAEVRHKLSATTHPHPRHLDFLDFLLYVPLFVLIHRTVVTDPLTLTRDL